MTADRASSTSAPSAATARSTDAVAASWSPLTALKIVDPRDFGAKGNGSADDTAALRRAVASLKQTGGVVFVADGLVYKTTDVVRIDGDHIKLWARSGRGRILAATGGAERRQAVVCQDVAGCGVHGVRFKSDASRRLLALEDSQVVFDGATDGEAVGLEIEGSASAAIFVYGRSTRTFVEGNYIHHSWSDSVHFTNGSRQAWVWGNTFFNGSSTKGDDGVACVTYGSDSLCGDMEWWDNRHLGTAWGRGFSVVGGERIHIHGNFARGIAGAGILVASEPSYDTPGSSGITIQNNVLFQTGQVVPHAGILVSALSAPISDVTVKNNLVVQSANGEDFRTEGDARGVTASNATSSAALLPARLPDIADGPRPTNTDVLKTRDASFVPAQNRRGLYRIHVQRSANGAGFEQRFEYVVAGPPAALDRWLGADGSIQLVDETTRGSERAAVVLSPRPVTVPSELRAVGFPELRAGDNDGSLADLWATLHP